MHHAAQCSVLSCSLAPLQAFDRAIPLLERASQLQPGQAQWKLALASCIWQTQSSFQVTGSMRCLCMQHAAPWGSAAS